MTPKWSLVTPTWSPKSPNRPPTWLYRQDFAKFSLDRHYNKIPEGSELAQMVANDAQMVASDANMVAKVAKLAANLALPPRFRQVLIGSSL
ncbi:hypothetical protein TNCV_3196851 [Trichonephila clavipes]|nr:hypothetical protein TNCV_3196851 [Trichonephila clavipes]